MQTTGTGTRSSSILSKKGDHVDTRDWDQIRLLALRFYNFIILILIKLWGGGHFIIQIGNMK